MRYAIIDIETTGGSPKTEKITEIAIFVHDGERVVDEYVTLINPERSIPPFITGLTGITNDMVADAPKFYEVAKQIVLTTENTIFVAHNANFDYGFVKTEFKHLGYNYERKTLDTVRLSRKLLPGHASYSLGKLCADLNIKINGRHRAAGDALATVKLFELLLSKNGAFHEAADPQMYKLLKGINSEHHKNLVQNLPEATGVYYFFNDNQQVIYIGKSINIKKRVAQHLRNAGGRKALEMIENISEVSYELTGSELVALLLESDEIKKHQPIYNRQQRRKLFAYGLYNRYDLHGYINFSIERINTKHGLPVATFKNMEEAKNHMFKYIEKYQLCQKLCGLYKSESACFHYGIKVCKGACVGKESHEDYNKRAMQFIESLNFKDSDFFIVDAGAQKEEKHLIRVKSGKYLGFGAIDEQCVGNIELMEDCIRFYADNRDVRQIINSFIRNKKYEKLIPVMKAIQ